MKYRIALFGTFDVENYGDLMFPEVLNMVLESRGIDYELFLFSPCNTTTKGLDPNTVVYSPLQIESLHNEKPFDAIVIGGGAIIHYNKIQVIPQNKSEFYDYRIADTWIFPILFAQKNHIKVLFNGPQVPHELPLFLDETTCNVFECCDYISVRDSVSKDYIDACFSRLSRKSPPVSVIPDTVCCLPTYLKKEKLNSICNDLKLPEKYAVIQFNAQRSDSDEYIVKIIQLLASKGIETLLLPIGNTHNDDVILKNFNDNNNGICHIIEDKLNIFEIAAILSNCQLYFGSSFHGAITSMIYGNVSISYNYILPKTKNEDIFSRFGADDFVVSTAEEAYKIICDLFENKIEFPKIDNSVSEKVEQHFDFLIEEIKNNKKSTNAQSIQLIDSIVNSFSQAISLYHTSLNQQNVINDLKDKIIDNESLQTKIKKQSVEINDLKGKIIDNESLQMKIKKQSVVINDQQAVIDSLNSKLFEFQNSFYWKITKIPRAITQKLKNFASRYKWLIFVLIIIKSFLSGGIKGVKRKLIDLRYVTLGSVKIPHTISNSRRKAEESTKFSKDIKISILVPLYNTPKQFLIEMIESVQNQTYSNWELCLADGSTDDFAFVGEYCKKLAEKDNRIVYKKLTENKGISENTNECLKLATGDYIALFDHDDYLHPSVLFETMKCICDKEADYVYTDEATFLEDDFDNIITCHCKPDFSFDNLVANNYICHFSVFSADLLKKTELFRTQYDGSQDHDFILRITNVAKNVVHIPKVLYFWRSHKNSVAMDINSKKYAIDAGINAVHDFLESKGLPATVKSSPSFPTIYRIKYEIKGNPKVSIIIPNKDHCSDLRRCINSILELSTYDNYEIIVVDNQSSDIDIKNYYQSLSDNEKVRIIYYDYPFNYSKINNFAAKNASGEHFLFLNNDTKVIEKDWIQELLMYSQRSDVGAVGAKLFFEDDTIQHAGIILGLGADRVAGHAHYRCEKRNLGYMGKLFYSQNVSAVTAACMMVKKDLFFEIGGFDEELAVAYNDVDFCLKLRKINKLNVFNPFCTLYHYESISRGLDTNKKNVERFTREKNLFIKKWGKTIDEGDPYYNPNFSLDASYKLKQEIAE